MNETSNLEGPLPNGGQHEVRGFKGESRKRTGKIFNRKLYRFSPLSKRELAFQEACGKDLAREGTGGGNGSERGRKKLRKIACSSQAGDPQNPTKKKNLVKKQCHEC